MIHYISILHFKMSETLSEEVYEFLINDDEPRACDSISEDNCKYVPVNFTANVANGSLTKLAEQLISPSLTLPWILQFLGSPGYLIGALVPVKNIGSLLPQLFVSGNIREKAIRKYYWVFAGTVQGLCMLSSGFLLLSIKGALLPWLIVLLLLIFSIGSGVGSVSFKDVMAKTIPKGQRGQMLSYRATFGGIFSLLAGLCWIFFLKDTKDTALYATLFFVAGILWLLAAFLFFLIQEQPGATQGGRNPIDEARRGWNILKNDSIFRRFLLTRSLLMGIPLVQPFYVVWAKHISGISWKGLGALILINGVAQIVSSPFWGKLADKSSAQVMRFAGYLALLAGACSLLFPYLPQSWQSFYAFLPVFFFNAMAHSGARLGRKTYLVDHAPGDDRPTYVSVANTFMGLFTILTLAFGLIATFVSIRAQLLFFMAMILLAVVTSFGLANREKVNS